MSRFRGIGVLLAALGVSASACAGTYIPRAQPGTYEFGRTTYEGILEQYHEPQTRMTTVRNGRKIESLVYVHFSAIAGAAHNSGVIPTRGTVFHFHDGLLVGLEFISSWEEDHSDFDDLQVARIVRGEASRADVVALLGEPSGEHKYPMTDEVGTEAVVYRYGEVRQGGGKTSSFEKNLVVTFDPQGLANEVDLTTTTSRIDD